MIIFIFSNLLYVSSLFAGQMSAKEIIDRATHLDQGKSVQASVKISVTEESGKTKARSMLLRRKWINGYESTRTDFTAPADIKGLALLIEHKEGEESDQHLYTPALRRVRRIRGSLKSQEFADTDFSYEDMERRNLEDADYALEGEEMIDSRSCYKIVATTKKKVRSQYGKTVSWIDKNSFLLKKIDLYDREGVLLKTMASLKSDQIAGVWTQLKLEMKNHSKKRKTTYEVEKIVYDAPLDSNLFTTSALGQ